MIDLLQDRSALYKHKKKCKSKDLPEIKYCPNIFKRNNDTLFMNYEHAKILSNYQPLSNILMSKQICPQQIKIPTPLQKKRVTVVPGINKNLIFKQTKRIVQTEEDNRNSTSLSYRIKVKEKSSSQILNEETFNVRTPLYKIQDLTFGIVKGNNNEQLVKQILLGRKIWKQIQLGERIPNLKWLFSNQRYNYKKMWSYTHKRIINHFQFSKQITTKDNLIKNLQIYCQTKKIQIFSITPITFIIDFDDEYCQYNLKQFLSFYIRNDQNKLNKKTNQYSIINKLQVFMGWQNSDIKKKVNILSRPVNHPNYYSESNYIWLLKPTGMNRGRGIEIFSSLESLEKILMNYLTLMNRKNCKDKNDKVQHQQQSTDSLDNKFYHDKVKLSTCSFVIQKYVEKPMLIQGRKFDIRIWTLLTENMNIYFFKEGYIRTSGYTYSTQNIEDYYIHLTNNAIQKNSESYGQFQNGNQLSFKYLKNLMSEQKVDEIWNRIKEITFMVYSSTKKKINQFQRKHCFEIFGLDYMISEDGKVWLIEVNQNPCLQCSSNLLSQLIPRMLHDAFKLTIDLIVERKPQGQVYPVQGYLNNENLWENLGHLTPNSEYVTKIIS